MFLKSCFNGGLLLFAVFRMTKLVEYWIAAQSLNDHLNLYNHSLNFPIKNEWIVSKNYNDSSL